MLILFTMSPLGHLNGFSALASLDTRLKMVLPPFNAAPRTCVSAEEFLASHQLVIVGPLLAGPTRPLGGLSATVLHIDDSVGNLFTARCQS